VFEANSYIHVLSNPRVAEEAPEQTGVTLPFGLPVGLGAENGRGSFTVRCALM
jgi:hypothetical protein